jgi:predicted phosphodiesterase
MKIAVIGDIHSNIDALTKAINIINSEGCNSIVLIGDILTYGPAPNECIDLILETAKNNDLRICLGNHDQTYNELLEGYSPYYEKLPDWIKESFEWTLQNINIDKWRSLDFQSFHSFDTVYFSHANPYEVNDWRYLNTEEDYSLALDEIKKKSHNLGVFGHTHRRRLFIEYSSGERDFNATCDVVLKLQSEKSYGVLNVGSVGQPRGDNSPSISWVEIQNSEIVVSTQFFTYEIERHLSRLDEVPVSEEAMLKIKSYFK